MTQQVATIPLKSDSRTLMGAIFLEQGKLRQEDIDCILQAQKQTGVSFGETAKGFGLLTDKDIEQALARQFGYHYVETQEAGFSPELVAAYWPPWHVTQPAKSTPAMICRPATGQDAR